VHAGEAKVISSTPFCTAFFKTNIIQRHVRCTVRRIVVDVPPTPGVSSEVEHPIDALRCLLGDLIALEVPINDLNFVDDISEI
jgi:hypothetical protein